MGGREKYEAAYVTGKNVVVHKALKVRLSHNVLLSNSEHVVIL